MIELVLFDLDGTLADTAPGLAEAANRQRLARGLGALPYEQLRPVASHGARGLLGTALGLKPDDDEYRQTRDQFLRDYAACMFAKSTLFDGVPQLLQALEQQQRAWGIVTNKVTHLAEPLIAHLGMQPAVIVCGDTTTHAKPHPLPLLHAAAQMKIRPESCIYIGDDLRDIQAGHAAGMLTVAAAWGYCGQEMPIAQWKAHHIAEKPADTWNILQMTLSV